MDPLNSVDPSVSALPSVHPSDSTLPSVNPSGSKSPYVDPSDSTSPYVDPSDSTLLAIDPANSTSPSMDPSDSNSKPDATLPPAKEQKKVSRVAEILMPPASFRNSEFGMYTYTELKNTPVLEQSPRITMEYYDGTSDSNSDDDSEESNPPDESEFQSYEFKHDGLSAESEQDFEDFVQTRQSIASDGARAAMRKHYRLESQRDRMEYINPRGSFAKCPQGEMAPANYYRRQNPGPWLHCPVPHMQSDTFSKLPFSTKPTPKMERWRRPTPLLVRKKRWYEECRDCDRFHMDLSLNPDQHYQNYVDRITYKLHTNMGKNWRDYYAELEWKMENYGYDKPSPLPKSKLADVKDKLGLRKSSGKVKTQSAKQEFEALKKILLSAEYKKYMNCKIRGEEYVPAVKSTVPVPIISKVSKPSKKADFTNIKPVVPRHILKKPRKSQRPVRKLQISKNVSKPVSATRPRYKPPTAESLAQHHRSYSSTIDAVIKKSLSTITLRGSIESDDDGDSKIEVSSEEFVCCCKGNESDTSYEDVNAQFRQPNGDFDDEKYRKCVIQMLVKDVCVNMPQSKPKPKVVKSKAKKKGVKGPYSYVKSRVDNKPPSSLRSMAEKKKVEKFSKVNPIKRKLLKKRRSKSGNLLSSTDSINQSKFFKDMADEVKREMEDSYFSIPDDLRI